MTTPTLSTTHLRRLLPAALCAATLTFGATGIADAQEYRRCNSEATPTGILHVREFSVQDTGQSDLLFTVEALASMTETDAYRYIDHPDDEAVFRIWGDLPQDDKLLGSVIATHYSATPEGLVIRDAALIPKDRANANWVPGLPDKWYASIELTEIRNGGGTHRVETCRLYSG
jgi:hypothetical protein